MMDKENIKHNVVEYIVTRGRFSHQISSPECWILNDIFNSNYEIINMPEELMYCDEEVRIEGHIKRDYVSGADVGEPLLISNYEYIQKFVHRNIAKEILEGGKLDDLTLPPSS